MGTPTKDDPPPASPPDFELRKYELDRAHELELNKFAHALEVERLKLLQIVNGGAFTVLLAFATGLLSSSGIAPTLAISAGVFWVVGLGAAAWATQRQLDGQAKFNSAYRFRRNAIEWRRLSEIYGMKAAALMIAPLHGEAERKNQRDSEMTELEAFADGDLYDDRADHSYYRGKEKQEHVKALAVASIWLFILGGLLLAYALAFADAGQFATPGKAAG